MDGTNRQSPLAASVGDPYSFYSSPSSSTEPSPQPLPSIPKTSTALARTQPAILKAEQSEDDVDDDVIVIEYDEPPRSSVQAPSSSTNSTLRPKRGRCMTDSSWSLRLLIGFAFRNSGRTTAYVRDILKYLVEQFGVAENHLVSEALRLAVRKLKFLRIAKTNKISHYWGKDPLCHVLYEFHDDQFKTFCLEMRKKMLSVEECVRIVNRRYESTTKHDSDDDGSPARKRSKTSAPPPPRRSNAKRSVESESPGTDEKRQHRSRDELAIQIARSPRAVLNSDVWLRILCEDRIENELHGAGTTEEIVTAVSQALSMDSNVVFRRVNAILQDESTFVVDSSHDHPKFTLKSTPKQLVSGTRIVPPRPPPPPPAVPLVVASTRSTDLQDRDREISGLREKLLDLKRRLAEFGELPAQDLKYSPDTACLEVSLANSGIKSVIGTSDSVRIAFSVTTGIPVVGARLLNSSSEWRAGCAEGTRRVKLEVVEPQHDIEKLLLF